MRLQDAFALAISALRGSVLRTMLTILGLAVGVGAVLTVLTLGSAGEERVEDEIAKLGVDKVWIRANDSAFTLQETDAQMLYQATQAPACAGAYTIATIALGDVSSAAQIAGFDSNMCSVQSPTILEGRTIAEREFQRGASVCLIDEALAQCLGNDVIGSRILVNNRRLRIIGMVKEMSAQTMSSGNGLLIMPLSTYLDTFGGHIAEITLSVQRGQRADDVAETALRALSSGKGFRADTLEEEIDAAREVVRIFVMVLLCVAVVCMITGGIGVMNVLLVSVRERRREIGLIKAIGAASYQVGAIFLLEAVVYALLGGLLGILFGIVMIYGFGTWIGLSSHLQVNGILPVLLGAISVGLVFGVTPAMSAARMTPVETLHSE